MRGPWPDGVVADAESAVEPPLCCGTIDAFLRVCGVTLKRATLHCGSVCDSNK